MGTILVVDDDEHIREFLRKSCATLATVIEAADGAQAIAAARWSHPDVVVMDLDMPVIDGFEAARQIKADPTLGDPVLVALTGNEAVNAVPRARAAGFSYFVRKETNARAFLDTIAGLLQDVIARAAARSADPETAGAALPAPESPPAPRRRRSSGAKPAPHQPAKPAKPSKPSKPAKRAAARKPAPARPKKVAAAKKPAARKRAPSGVRSKR